VFFDIRRIDPRPFRSASGKPCPARGKRDRTCSSRCLGGQHEKAPAHCLGLGGPCWGGEYARVRSRLTGSPRTAFHRQPKFRGGIIKEQARCRVRFGAHPGGSATNISATTISRGARQSARPRARGVEHLFR
jgi:hypothetical protein